MILRKCRGFLENIAGRVEVDCGLVLAKFEGFFEKFSKREGWTAGFILRKLEGFFVKWRRKARSEQFARPIRRPGNARYMATLPGQGMARAGTPFRFLEIA